MQSGIRSTARIRDSVLMSRADADELGLTNGDRVQLKNDLGQFEGRVLIAPIATGNLQIHWPEGNVIIHRGSVDAPGWCAQLQRLGATGKIVGVNFGLAKRISAGASWSAAVRGRCRAF